MLRSRLTQVLLGGGALLLTMAVPANAQTVSQSADVNVSNNTITVTAGGMSFSTPPAPAQVSSVLTMVTSSLPSPGGGTGNVTIAGGPLVLMGSSSVSGTTVNVAGTGTFTPPASGLPGLPSLPGLPALPTSGLPGLPSLPTGGLPGLPSLPTSGLPGLPSLPTGGLPGLPSLPTTGLPALPVSLPGL